MVWEGDSSNRKDEFQVQAGPCFRTNVERKLRTRAKAMVVMCTGTVGAV